MKEWESLVPAFTSSSIFSENLRSGDAGERDTMCLVSRAVALVFLVAKGKGGKGSGVWPSMVTHTRNLSSAFNPSKCTLTAVNTHLEQWAAILRRPGSSWGIGALLKGLTSVVVLKVERALVIHSPHRQSLPDLGIEPATFGLQVQLSNH